jgi:6-pyruvoyltetrahydropterin/6-carboxytetrahydropterin synthase
MEIFREFTFEAAHSLPHAPVGHKCRELHGHSYRLFVHVTGKVETPTGWVADFADVKRLVNPIVDQLDHHHLNDIAGLEQSTVENVARWLWPRLRAVLPGLSHIVLWETAKSGCVYRGEDESVAGT